MAKQIKNNYDILKQVAELTSPLPKETPDIPTIAIDTELYDYAEDKAQVELEVELEKKGVPVIDVERPPVTDVKTDPTPYKKISVVRKEKESDTEDLILDEDLTLTIDREMQEFAKHLKIAKHRRILWIVIAKLEKFYNKIQRWRINFKRKRTKIFANIFKAKPSGHGHILPNDVKTVALKDANLSDIIELGRERNFQREEDKEISAKTICTVRNKKTGVVVVTPSITAFKDVLESRGHNINDYEIVESKIKNKTEKEGIVEVHPLVHFDCVDHACQHKDMIPIDLEKNLEIE